MSTLRPFMCQRAAKYLAERGEKLPPMSWLLSAYDEWLLVEAQWGDPRPQDVRQYGFSEYCVNRLTLERSAEARRLRERGALLQIDIDPDCPDYACVKGMPYSDDLRESEEIKDMDALDAAQEIRG